MSVPVGNRKESAMEFLVVARDIEIAFIDLRINKPKRYTFFFDKMLDLSITLLSEAKEGNSIYPENQIEVGMRIRHFKEALAICQALVSQVEVLHHKLGEDGLPIGIVQKVSELLTQEIKLLKGIISKDKDRYKNLPAGQ